MNPSKQQEFRLLLIQFTKEIPEVDAQTMIDAIEQLEQWIDNYTTQAITAAIERHKKNNNNV